MSTKSNKTNIRIKINTSLLLIMSIAFGVITFTTASNIYKASNNFQSVSDAPGLCYDETKTDNAFIRDNSYICTTEHDEDGNALSATTDNEYTLFLYDRLTLSSLIRSGDHIAIVIAAGSMFTIAGLVTTFVYWNHNKAKTSTK